MSDGHVCGNCKFYRVNRTVQDNEGECRRYAPRPFLTQTLPNHQIAVWPMTADQQWCGEFSEYKLPSEK